MTLLYGVQIKASQIVGELDIGFAISADWNRREQMNKFVHADCMDVMHEYPV